MNYLFVILVMKPRRRQELFMKKTHAILWGTENQVHKVPLQDSNWGPIFHWSDYLLQTHKLVTSFWQANICCAKLLYALKSRWKFIELCWSCKYCLAGHQWVTDGTCDMVFWLVPLFWSARLYCTTSYFLCIKDKAAPWSWAQVFEFSLVWGIFHYTNLLKEHYRIGFANKTVAGSVGTLCNPPYT